MHGHARQELQAQLEETIQALRAVGMQNWCQSFSKQWTRNASTIALAYYASNNGATIVYEFWFQRIHNVRNTGKCLRPVYWLQNNGICIGPVGFMCLLLSCCYSFILGIEDILAPPFGYITWPRRTHIFHLSQSLKLWIKCTGTGMSTVQMAAIVRN
jgi:hypothetical protein